MTVVMLIVIDEIDGTFDNDFIFLLLKGLGPNMVLVNAATGAPISAPTANSLSGTMTTQSTNSASLPAGISVQQLLQQAQQQQAAQAQQVQQQVNICFLFILMTVGNDFFHQKNNFVNYLIFF